MTVIKGKTMKEILEDKKLETYRGWYIYPVKRLALQSFDYHLTIIKIENCYYFKEDNNNIKNLHTDSIYNAIDKAVLIDRLKT